MIAKLSPHNMTIQCIRNDMIQSRLWSSFDSADFLAQSYIESYTESSNMSYVPDRVLSSQHDRNTGLERISAMAKHLYCTLLYIGRIDLVQPFLAAGFSGSDLPLGDGPLPASLKIMIDRDREFWDRFLKLSGYFSLLVLGQAAPPGYCIHKCHCHLSTKLQKRKLLRIQ